MKLFDLDFADDIALLSDSFKIAQAQPSTTAKLAKEVGLEINIKKTEAFSNKEHAGNRRGTNRLGQTFQVSWFDDRHDRIRYQDAQRTSLGRVLENEECISIQEHPTQTQNKHL